MAVYYIQAVEGGNIKIGTTVELRARLGSLRRSTGEDLRIVAITKGHQPEERAIHRRFAHLRVTGEWFLPEDDLLEYIAAEGVPWDGNDEPAVMPMKVWMHYMVAWHCKYVAGLRGITVGEYLSECMKEIVERDAKIEGRLAWKNCMEEQGCHPDGSPLEITR